MGSGIAQTAIQHGFEVILYDPDPRALERAGDQIRQQLQQLVDRAKISDSARHGMLHHLRFADDIADCKADLIIEAIVEIAEAKVDLFLKLYARNAPETIFASNTSSLSIAAIAAQLPDASRFMGLHFFNPATHMKLVEVVRLKESNEGTVAKLLQLARDLGKTPVTCFDAPGFIVNRVARPYYIEALRLAEEGVDPETIDLLMEAAGFRMGPFRLMDLIGNDINYAVSCSVYQQLGEPSRLQPSFIQQALVNEGKLGRKSGAGFYTYHS
ncbi:putative 3-hydroxybutyryl-CoA dehydrogenase [Flavihumibacter petaseus NBRC 106054]|uniref:Putative 3-hydroxybutyryl-CoA dehydrogenase n=2 Tax=Flavihumibacter TaxID=1004301 RepID=A0A0E9N0I5_9BACT|nr:putative 3-hydroxybutyryl-CoA dehydrogenase [Flavihumibacter petaseus NBRC 106054]